MKKLLSIIMAIAMMISLVPVMDVAATGTGGSTSDVEGITFNYAYDVQRDPAFPKKGDYVKLYNLQNPTGSNEYVGNWKLERLEKYSAITEESIKTSLSKVITEINIYLECINIDDIVIYELKNGGTHIAYGVMFAYDSNKAFFIGDSLPQTAGYLLSKDPLNGDVYITANLDIIDGNYSHNYENAPYKKDDKNHWKECTNVNCPDKTGSKKDEGAHSGGEATCIEKAICKDCEVAYGEKDANNHTGEEVWQKTATKHKKVYSCCDKVVEAEAYHNWSNGTCTVCDYECAHTGGTATCKEKAVCDECHETYGNFGDHEYEHIVENAQIGKAGKSYDKCKVCGYIANESVIAALPEITYVSKQIVTSKPSWKKNSMKIGWNKIEQADGYDVFVRRCDGKKFSSKPTATIKNNKTTSCTVKKVGGKSFNQRKTYKYIVKAYQIKNGKKVYISSTKTMHFAGKKSKYTNAKKVTVKKSSVTLSVGKSSNISAKIVKENAKKKLLNHSAKFRYSSENTKVATVSSKGKIVAKSKGSCYVYVIANNGQIAKVKVTVK